jgi:hypothetical protein
MAMAIASLQNIGESKVEDADDDSSTRNVGENVVDDTEVIGEPPQMFIGGIVIDIEVA